jgi:hypothetical protein
MACGTYTYWNNGLDEYKRYINGIWSLVFQSDPYDVNQRHVKYEYFNGKCITPISVNVIISLLHFKNRLRKRARQKIQKQYLDKVIIGDLGNIIMMYYVTQ